MFIHCAATLTALLTCFGRRCSRSIWRRSIDAGVSWAARPWTTHVTDTVLQLLQWWVHASSTAAVSLDCTAAAMNRCIRAIRSCTGHQHHHHHQSFKHVATVSTAAASKRSLVYGYLTLSPPTTSLPCRLHDPHARLCSTTSITLSHNIRYLLSSPSAVQLINMDQQLCSRLSIIITFILHNQMQNLCLIATFHSRDFADKHVIKIWA